MKTNLTHFNRRKFITSIAGAAFLTPTLQSRSSEIEAFKILRPGPYPDGLDTWFGTHYNKTAQFTGNLQIGGWGDQYITLLRFNLSGMPLQATRAYLWLYCVPRGDDSKLVPIDWDILDSQWQTETVSAMTPLTSSDYYGQSPSPQLNSWNRENIVAAYNAWRKADPILNFGLRLRPAENNNRFNVFISSGNTQWWLRPQLQVFYIPQNDDNILRLKWPLSALRDDLRVSLPFGARSTIRCSDGVRKAHNGTDYARIDGTSLADTSVYAAEDGIFREMVIQDGEWASSIVLEHNSPDSRKFTTVYWHINPSRTLLRSKFGDFIPRGMQIGTIADLGRNTHFHFGVRLGSYTINLSGRGALPFPESPCGDESVFPAGFVNPENQTTVIFD